MVSWLLHSLLIGCDLVESLCPASAESALPAATPSYDGAGTYGGGMDAGVGAKVITRPGVSLISAHLDFSEELAVESVLCLGPV